MKWGVMTHPTQPGLHKIFFVWYPKIFPKDLSYETRDCVNKKKGEKKAYKPE